MRTGAVASAILVLTVGSTSHLSAQTYVSFEVPLNLTQVPPDIERVRVSCFISGEGLVNPFSGGLGGTATGGSVGGNTPLPLTSTQQEIIVFGQLVGSVKLIVTIPAEWLDNPIGKTAQYACILDGYSKSMRKWSFFTETSTEPAFKLKVTPDGGQISGTFVW